MKSIKMDFVRDGEDTAIFEKGRTYHVVIESSQHRQFKMPLRQEDFLTCLAELRYHEAISEEQRTSALHKLSQVATEILMPPEDSKDTLQLDLVTSARELWALPFEAALASDGKPLLARKEPAVVLTRRAPKSFAERQLQWPARPRILFAYASPEEAGDDSVDDLAHREALIEVLRPWGDPEKDDGLLTICEEASLADIKQACEKAEAEGKPYTHVHLLAHGIKVTDPVYTHLDRFGIALRSAGDAPTMPEELVPVLWPQRAPDWKGQELPVVVTLAICDAANAENSIIRAGGLAQELHSAGVPIVIASQLPLTFKGAEIMTRSFYKGWMAGEDVRTVLHKTRVALHEDEESAHDWVSLVAYVRLPEGYNDYRLEIRLKSQFAAMETASNSAERLFSEGIEDDSEYAKSVERLLDCVSKLEQFLKEHEGLTHKRKKELVQENSGQLGSAYKRLGELLDTRARVDPAHEAHWRAESRLAMEKARDAYHNGFLHNTSNHWNGVQYLALETVLNGEMSNIAVWHACNVAAITQRDHPDSSDEQRLQALGSIAELGLLAELAPAGWGIFPEDGLAALVMMNQRVKETPELFRPPSPTQSTYRQLMRYIHWWTQHNGFFDKRDSDLAQKAQELAELLEP